MIWMIIRKEILEHMLSLRFAISCVVCFVVILCSVFVMTRGYKEEMVDYRTNLVMHRNEVLEYDSPWNLTYQGVHVDKPLNPMKIFFVGIEPENTKTARISPQSETSFQSSYDKNPVLPLFPSVDMTFFVGIIMSLLAITFSYDAVSGEKERGTLRLMMSYSVPRDVVILGKWVGGYVSLIGPFLLSVLCGLILVMVYPEVSLSEEDWVSLMMIGGMSLLYISSVYSLGILISARTHMASTSIMVLLLIWVIVVLGVPNLSPYIASLIRPTESVRSVEEEKRKIEQEQWKKFQEAFFEHWYPEAREKGIPFEEIVEKYNTDRRETQTKIASEQEKVKEHFRRGLSAQVNLAKHISRLSPLSSFVYCATDLSGTGDREADHFRRELARYKDKWTDYAYAKFEGYDFKERPELDTKDYPRFVYASPALNDRIEDVFLDVLLLGVWNVVFFMGTYLSFLRYDVK